MNRIDDIPESWKRPLNLDFPEDSVRAVDRRDEVQLLSFEEAEEFGERRTWAAPGSEAEPSIAESEPGISLTRGEQARQEILRESVRRVEGAVRELADTLDIFGVIDHTDYRAVLRPVEALANTIRDEARKWGAL